MATETKRPARTEVLSMRMDPKTRFLVEVIARLRGQSITTVVERAILEAADGAYIGGADNRKTWRSYWHMSDGVRSLQMAAEPGLYPTYEDEKRLEFARTHWVFFYRDQNLKTFKPWFVDILWPHIDDFLELWEKTQASAYFAAAHAMQKVLRDAGLEPPDWPVKPPPKPAPPPPKVPSGGAPSWDAPKGGDLDDEIPF